MCGIAAIFAYGEAAPPVDAAELLRIRDQMTKRGPDGSGLYVDPSRRLGLAHRRLAIIDLSDAACQPMSTADTRLHVVFNGEIYNYRELRRELEGKGFTFQTTSDTEVLLHLYADRGAEMVHALRGMYAFAIWDATQKELFLARDPFGVKPLYYANDGGTIRVASQVKALLAGEAIHANPEPAGHVGFFLWGHVPEPYTLHRTVRALPAGSTLSVRAGGRPRLADFFNLTRELAREHSNERECAENASHELHAALLDSVRHHLVADVPVGVFLSAGLDSTILTELAREACGSQLHTVTLGFSEFRGTVNDEVPLAELIARHVGTIHETRWVRKDEFHDEFDALLDAMDQPTTDGVNVYFVSKAAANAGLKAALSGLGGDELFGGYSSFRDLPRLVTACNRLGDVPFIGKGFRYLSAPLLKRLTSPKYAGILEYGASYGGAYLLRRGMFMPWELPDVLDPDLIREGWRELDTLSRLEATVDGIEPPRLKVTALEAAWYMRNQLLRDSDWASMAHSLEIRVPFVDVQLLRALVPMLKSSSPPTKVAAAQGTARPLPQALLQRKKTGFSIPVREWLLDREKAARPERGLRGWARQIYGAAAAGA